jgi:Cu-Zn family superoxide dismutase
MTVHRIMVALAALASVATLACGRAADGERSAHAAFSAAPGYELGGEASLREVGDGVLVSVEINHGPPGTKGIHIHQIADCSNIPGKSMGEHFSPEAHQHGLPTAPEHHLGDLGNIEIEADGTGSLEMTIARASLKPGDPLSFLGKAIVVHAQEDVGTPPTGESGTPIACAPIAAG